MFPLFIFTWSMVPSSCSLSVVYKIIDYLVELLEAIWNCDYYWLREVGGGRLDNRCPNTDKMNNCFTNLSVK